MWILPFEAQIKHTTRTIERNHAIKAEVTFCVRGVLSPLLANIYMRRFVLGWKKLGLEQSLGTRFVTYADDLVILCHLVARINIQAQPIYSQNTG